jgi:hypothetical protein
VLKATGDGEETREGRSQPDDAPRKPTRRKSLFAAGKSFDIISFLATTNKRSLFSLALFYGFDGHLYTLILEFLSVFRLNYVYRLMRVPATF